MAETKGHWLLSLSGKKLAMGIRVRAGPKCFHPFPFASFLYTVLLNAIAEHFFFCLNQVFPLHRKTASSLIGILF